MITAGAGTYEVDVYDANGCELLGQTYTITEPEALTATHAATNISCHDANDGRIEVTAMGGNGGTEYALNGGPFQTSNTFTGLTEGSYDVVVRDAEGCTFEAIRDVAIINPPPLELEIRALDQINVGCKGEATGSVTLTATGGTGDHSYQLDGEPFQPNNRYANLEAGDYTFTVRDANGCQATTSTTITEPDEVLAVTLEEVNATCDTDGRVTALVTGGTPPYNYAWRSTFPVEESLEDSDAEIIVPAGNYPLTVTDANGCQVFAAGNLSSDDGAMVKVESQTQPSCSYVSDGQAEISLEGIAPFEVLWDHGETGTRATQLSTGDNWFNVIDANDCLVRDRITFAAPRH